MYMYVYIGLDITYYGVSHCQLQLHWLLSFQRFDRNILLKFKTYFWSEASWKLERVKPKRYYKILVKIGTFCTETLVNFKKEIILFLSLNKSLRTVSAAFLLIYFNLLTSLNFKWKNELFILILKVNLQCDVALMVRVFLLLDSYVSSPLPPPFENAECITGGGPISWRQTCSCPPISN